MIVAGLILLTFVASFFGTIVGFGSSTLMLPIVVLFLPLPEALLFVGIIHFFNDAWESLLFKEKINYRLLLFFGCTGVIFSLVGAKFALVINQHLLSQILGIILIGYSILFALKPRFSLSQTSSSLIIGGSLSGFLAGIFGVGGPIRSLFLSSYKLPTDMYLFTIGVVSLFVDLARIGVYVYGGTRVQPELFVVLIFLIPVSFIAAELAQKTVHHIPEKLFRIILLSLLIIIGIKFLITP